MRAKLTIFSEFALNVCLKNIAITSKSAIKWATFFKMLHYRYSGEY